MNLRAQFAQIYLDISSGREHERLTDAIASAVLVTFDASRSSVALRAFFLQLSTAMPHCDVDALSLTRIVSGYQSRHNLDIKPLS